MNNDIKHQILRSSPLGSELNDDDCRVLADIMHIRNLNNDEVLIQEGQTDHSLDILISGELAVLKDTGAGELVTLYILKPGEFAGAMDFIDARERKTSLRAIGDTVVSTLRREAFETLVESHPWLIYRVMRAITRTIHGILLNMDQQCEELTNYVIKQHGRY